MLNKPLFTIRIGQFRIEFHRQSELVRRAKQRAEAILHDLWVETWRIF